MQLKFISFNLVWVVFLLFLFLFIFVRFSYKIIKKINTFKKNFLTLLRSLIFLLLSLAILKPVISYSFYKTKKEKILVLLDNSASMSIQHRMEKLKEIIKSKRFGEFSKKFDLAFLSFGEKVSHTEIDKLKADEPETDFYEAISYILQHSGTEKINKAIIFSDGNNTGSEPLEELKALKSQNIPIYCISPPIEEKLSDISIFLIDAPKQISVDTTASIKLGIGMKGFKNKTVPVLLKERDKLIQRKEIFLTDEAEYKKIEFNYKPEKEGVKKLICEVPIFPGETVKENNKEFLFLKVIKAKFNVLLIYGKPCWEYKFLRRCLEANENIKLNPIVKVKFEDFKNQISNLTLQKYDLVIIGNIKSQILGDDFLNQLTSYIKKGGNLLLLGGENSFYQGNYQNSTLRDVLPIVWDEAKGIYETDFTIKITPTGKLNPVIRFVEDPIMNQKIWDGLPPCEMLNIIKRLKDGAEIVGVCSKREDLITLAFSKYGLGNICIFPVYPTWKWHFLFYGFSEESNYHYQFYQQIVQYLTASKKEQFSLTTEKFNYLPREEIKIIATIYDAHFNPITDISPIANIYKNDNLLTEVKLQNTKILKERYTGSITLEKFGNYKVSLEVSHPLLKDKRQTDFIIFPLKNEFKKIDVDSEFLKKIAHLTGGKYFNFNNYEKLFDIIPEVKEKIPIKAELELWNTYPFFILIIGLLLTEWILRKKYGLL